MTIIFAYVDESGQDTLGKIFLVSVIIVGKQRDTLRRLLKEIERWSRKGSKKWTKTPIPQRAAYMGRIIQSKVFASKIYFSHYTSHHADAHSYIDLAILTTAKAILARIKRPYQARVYVDGLGEQERKQFTAGLRKLHIKTRMAQGLRDQSDEFIRLADAVAGFARDGIENDKVMRPLYKQAINNQILVEI